MSERKRLSLAIDTAVGCLPSELCNIAADYLNRFPHGWTDIDTGQPTASIRGVAAGRWTTFVSTQTLADGDLRWIVDFDFSNTSSLLHLRIGIGVTMNVRNYISKTDDLVFDQMTDDRTWIICPFLGTMYTVSGGSISNGGFLSAAILDDAARIGSRYRVTMNAYPADGSVRATVQKSTIDGQLRDITDPPVTLTSSAGLDKTKPAFDLLRPCVVIDDQLVAVVSSSSTI